jgi:hypothetical protein
MQPESHRIQHASGRIQLVSHRQQFDAHGIQRRFPPVYRRGIQNDLENTRRISIRHHASNQISFICDEDPGSKTDKPKVRANHQIGYELVAIDAASLSIEPVPKCKTNYEKDERYEILL